MDSAADHSRIERRERYGGVLEVTEGGHGQGTRGEGENSRPRHASIAKDCFVHKGMRSSKFELFHINLLNQLTCPGGTAMVPNSYRRLLLTLRSIAILPTPTIQQGLPAVSLREECPFCSLLDLNLFLAHARVEKCCLRAREIVSVYFEEGVPQPSQARHSP